MANFVLEPNMNLTIPTVGVELSPAWAQETNQNWTTIGAHTHLPGSGVPITSGAININALLPMNGNTLGTIGALSLSPQSAVALLTSMYCIGADLYYRDGNNNQVRITQSGSVTGSSGTITGLPSGTASASYAAGTFTFQSATATPANIDGGSYVLRNNVASGFGLTLQPPNLSSSYALTLPTIPGVQSIVSLDTSGNLLASYTVDNSTIQISGNVIQVKALGINTAQIAAGAVTRPKLVSVGQQISASSGVFSTSSGSFSNVTNLSVTITTSGRPVMVMLIPDGVSTNCSLGAQGGASNFAEGLITRNSTGIALYDIFTSGAATLFVPLGTVSMLDTPTAGTYTYVFQLRSLGGTATIQGAKLVAYEL